METLNQILEENPEWGDLPVAIYRSDGGLDYVGCSGSVYESHDSESDEPNVLVFAPN